MCKRGLLVFIMMLSWRSDASYSSEKITEKMVVDYIILENNNKKCFQQELWEIQNNGENKAVKEKEGNNVTNSDNFENNANYRGFISDLNNIIGDRHIVVEILEGGDAFTVFWDKYYLLRPEYLRTTTVNNEMDCQKLAEQNQKNYENEFAH